jgi:hypothetical protein
MYPAFPKTIEVDISWLEAEGRAPRPGAGAKDPKPKANDPMPKKEPPPLPGEPAPARRETIEVQAEWLEPDRPESIDVYGAPGGVPADASVAGRRKLPPPLPREDPDARAPRPRRTSRPPSTRRRPRPG